MIESIGSDVLPWSLKGYQKILELARSRGYTTSCFKDFSPADATPVLLLRHDLDHSLRAALPMAELESGLGIRSTYFVQVTCDFYNLLGQEGRAIVRRMVTLGHEVGLHYDSRRYAEALSRGGLEQAEQSLRLDMSLLEDISGQPVISASQHIPTEGPDFDVSAHIVNEAYAPRFTEGEMQYISDSLMAWRQATPLELINTGASFQLLTHPMNWGDALTGMHSALERALAKECDALRTRYIEVESYYEDLMKRRTDLDARFRARRSGKRGHG